MKRQKTGSIETNVLMLTGNEAVAYATKLVRAQVIPMYPIAPSTDILEKIVELIHEKQLDAEFIPAESEHSVMAAAIGAEATGARTFTVSASQGICYMHENLFVASGLRLPMVMAMVNRTIAPPTTIFPDQLDSLAQRDTGWIQIYVENNQEIVDTIIQAYRISEDERILLPVAVCFEGFFVSHFFEPVIIPLQEAVDKFLPPYHPKHAYLDPSKPMNLGVSTDDLYYTEYRFQQQEAMQNAKGVIEEVNNEFKSIFGRDYGGLIQTYLVEDAEIAFLSMGSFCGTIRVAIRELRKKGLKIGLIKLRSFRPFPREKIRQICENLSLIAVLERNVSVGSCGIVYTELASALYGASSPFLVDFIAGLGGRDVDSQLINRLAYAAIDFKEKGEVKNPVIWVGVRGSDT